MSAASAVLTPPTANLPLDGPVESVTDTSTVDYEPFLPDTKYHKTSPPASSTLTEKQEAVYQEVLKHFATEDYVIPGLENEDGDLTEEEKFYLTYECFLRFLRATRWDTRSCIAKLEATLKWRREYGIYDTLTLDSIKEHCLKGKVFLLGYDVEGRPGFFDVPERESSPEGPGRIRQYVWMMERAVEIMPRGVESVATIALYSGAAKSASFGHARQIVDTLQAYFPERLGRCVVTNGPFWLSILMRLIDPFLDPVTRSKIAINRQLVAEGDFASDQMIAELGGKRELVWDCDRYLNKLVEISGEMREKRLNKWRELGGTIGLREWDYKEE